MTPGVDNKNLKGIRLASMWTEGLAEGTPREVRQTLLELSQATTIFRDFQNGVRRQVGYTDQYFENMSLQFSPGDQIQIGADLQQRLLVRAGLSDGGVFVLRRPLSYRIDSEKVAPVLNENEEFIKNENGELIFTFVRAQDAISFEISTDALQPRYVLPLPEGLRPTVIRGIRDLVVGLDFSLGANCVIFMESAEILFPDWRMLIRSGEYTTKTPFSFTWQLDGLRAPGKHVAHYLRESQSTGAFRKAALEVAGLQMIPADATLQDIKVSGDLTRYVFPDFVVDVDYPHTALSIGSFYERDAVVGDAVQVYGPAAGSWWRAFDWTAGLSLDGLCPFSGLLVPDQLTKFYYDGGARFDMVGLKSTQDLFWACIRQNEADTGIALNAVIGLADPASTLFLNPLDVLFQYLLGTRAIVIRIKTDLLGDLRVRNLEAFINRERPMGSLTIIQHT